MERFAFVGMSHLVAVMKAAFGERTPVELWGWAGQLQEDFSLFRLPADPARPWPCDSIFHLVHPKRTWGTRPPVREEDGRLVVHPNLERFAALAQDEERTVVSYLYGSGHCAGIFRTDPDFDFVVPSADHLPVEPGCRLVPYDVVLRRLPDVTLTAQLLLYLRHATGRPVVHMLPPPPIPDERVFHEHRESWSETDLARGVNSRWKRLKYYLAYRDALRRVIPAGEVRVIEPPTAASDGDGFLAPALWAYSTHANERFGAMLLDEVRCTS